jgi:hypothetical protein
VPEAALNRREARWGGYHTTPDHVCVRVAAQGAGD